MSGGWRYGAVLACWLGFASIGAADPPRPLSEGPYPKVPHVQEWFDYSETDGARHRLEVTRFDPPRWNGQIVVISHGSTGDDPKQIKFTWKFLKMNEELTARGYRTLVLMRKGRGKSEGEFTEENGRNCEYGERLREVKEAEPQLDQFVDHVRSVFGVSRVILLGHSRGGFLSAYYAPRHPEKVSWVVNLAGGWATRCESRSRLTVTTLQDSASGFKNQLWIYASNDKYFRNEQLVEFGTIADAAGIRFLRFEAPAPDGHGFGYMNAHLWADTLVALTDAAK